MQISLIAAISTNRVIGIDNKLPWHLSADLQHFKKITMGQPIIMGRKTYESIGKPLPGRKTIIVSYQPDLKIQDCEVVNSIEAALAIVKDHNEVFIIGGSAIFQQSLHLANRLYITLIHQHFEGDSFFPEINSADWQEIERKDFLKDEKNNYDYSFLIYQQND